MLLSNIVTIVLILLAISCLLLVFYSIRSGIDYRKEMLNVSQYTANTQAIIDDSIPLLLNSVIDECFTDYKVLVLEPRQEGYISNEREDEIRKDLISKIVERLSPMSLDKLSLRYNINNIDRIIADKVYIVVTNYVVEHNDIKDNLEEVPG